MRDTVQICGGYEMFRGSVLRLGGFTILVGAAASCAAWQSDADGFTEQEVTIIEGMKLVPLPTDVSNAVLGDPRAEALGQALFFDPTLSGPIARVLPDQPVTLGAQDAAGRIACADCHTPTSFFDDTRTTPNNVSLGIDLTSRNSPSMVNVSLYQSWAWDGRSDSLWMQCAVAHESKAATGGTRLRLVRRLGSTYAAQYQQLYGDAGFATDGGIDPPLEPIAANAYKAMAAYLSKLISANAPIDAYAAGDKAALTVAQKRGLEVFLGRAGCVECHSGPNFTDNKFHSVGIPQRGVHVPNADQGRFAGLNEQRAGNQSVFNRCGPYRGDRPCTPIAEPGDSDRGQFRTKSLRNVELTAPYMHAGQLATLDAVVRFYNAGGETTGFAGKRSPQIVPLGLTEEEISDLVAFLQALTGARLDPRLTCDPSPRDTDAHRYPACPDGGL